MNKIEALDAAQKTAWAAKAAAQEAEKLISNAGSGEMGSTYFSPDTIGPNIEKALKKLEEARDNAQDAIRKIGYYKIAKMEEA